MGGGRETGPPSVLLKKEDGPCGAWTVASPWNWRVFLCLISLFHLLVLVFSLLFFSFSLTPTALMFLLFLPPPPASLVLRGLASFFLSFQFWKSRQSSLNLVLVRPYVYTVDTDLITSCTLQPVNGVWKQLTTRRLSRPLAAV